MTDINTFHTDIEVNCAVIMSQTISIKVSHTNIEPLHGGIARILTAIRVYSTIILV